MAKARTEYEVIARGIRGREVIFYDIQTDDKKIRCTPDQFAFLVGRKQIKNVSGQMYGGKVMYSGVGCKLTGLPIIRLNDSAPEKENIDTSTTETGNQVSFDKVKTPDVIITKDINKAEPDIIETNIFDKVADDINSLIEEDNYNKEASASICLDEDETLPITASLDEVMQGLNIESIPDIAELIN